MAKLTADRNTKRREGTLFGFEAAEQIFCGGMVALNANGKLVAATADGKVVVGMAEDSGKVGDMIRVRRGVFCFDNNGLTLADVGNPCVVVDDQTVGKQAAGEGATTSATVGILLDIDEAGAWVKI